MWDLNGDLSSPYTPSSTSRADITTLAWNKAASHILATGTGNDNTVIWDLRSRKDLMTLGGAGRGTGRGVSGVSWSSEV